MLERERLLAALKQLLKERGWRYADLAAAVGVSEPTIKRILSTGRMDLDRLERICEVLEIDFFELARAASGTRQSRRLLSLRQEQALADAPRLMMVFHMLCQGWRSEAIATDYGMAHAELVQLLARLDRVGLIELLPGDRTRLRVARDFSWRDDGPVRARYLAAASQEFMQDAFDAPQALLALEVRELGDASIATLRRKLERLVVEFREAADVDVSLPHERRRSVGMLVAMRPWVFSLANSLRVADTPVAATPARGGRRRARAP